MKLKALKVEPVVKYDIPKVAQPKAMTPHKTLKAMPHPHQDRLEQHRALPSLITSNPEHAPKGK